MIPERRCSGVTDRRKTHESDSMQEGKPVSAVESFNSADNPVPEKTTAAVFHALDTRHEDILRTREDALEGREAEVLRRETDASARERSLSNMHTLTIAQENLNRQLRQANEQLVIATVKSHETAEYLERSAAEMTHLANHDFLTNLPNRMQLYDRIGQAITFATRHRGKLAILFLDLDKFKAVNDTLGHAVGDLLLRSVAERLKSAIRRSDTVSRQGGDEFVILLSEVGEEEKLRSTIEKIRNLISAPYRIAGADLNIGVTIGVSLFPEHGEDTESLVRSADSAMYYAKQRGRNQYLFFHPEMRNGDGDNAFIPVIHHARDENQLLLF